VVVCGSRERARFLTRQVRDIVDDQLPAAGVAAVIVDPRGPVIRTPDRRVVVGVRTYTSRMGERGVSQESIVDAAEMIAEKLDVLLERATDTVLGTPRPGSPQWRQDWDSRDSDAGRTAAEQRVMVKEAITALALRHYVTPTARQAPRPHRRSMAASAPVSQQLAIW
jgi:hypothetical protein